MKKSIAHRRLALAASKKGYKVQIHRNGSENNCRLVAPDGSMLATTLKINSSTHYDTASVVEAIRDIERLNAAENVDSVTFVDCTTEEPLRRDRSTGTYTPEVSFDAYHPAFSKIKSSDSRLKELESDTDIYINVVPDDGMISVSVFSSTDAMSEEKADRVKAALQEIARGKAVDASRLNSASDSTRTLSRIS